MTTTLTDVVISATQLQDLLTTDADVVVLDIRRNADEVLREDYDAGHIPGARFIDHIAQLAGTKTASSGKNPLPTKESIQESVRRWGINPDSIVVVYGEGQGAPMVTRAWWTLKWAGVPDVRYLDGGLAAWQAAGGEVTQKEPADGNGTLQVQTGSLPTIDPDEAQSLARSGLLFDARPVEAYLGGPVEAGQPGQGHIPGAISVPYSDNLDAEGLLLSNETIREHYASFGADGSKQIGLYCGGGVGATTGVLALYRIGIPAALFVGSWTQWSSDPSRPVVTGDQPG